MSKPPIEVPQGAIRFNTDSQRMELYSQDQWWEIESDLNNPLGGRGLYGGGWPASKTVIDMITITTAGNSVEF